MTFGNRRDRHPHAHCMCGHPANKHLYCEEHYCIDPDCSCQGFTPAARETWLSPAPQPPDAASTESL